MQLFKADSGAGKGWYAGPWNADLDVSVGYASVGVDEPHVHTQITEIYLIARGESRIRIGSETIQLAAGDMLVVEPGEPHTFLDSTPGYFHFVIHTPGLSGEAARADKRPVPRGRLEL